MTFTTIDDIYRYLRAIPDFRERGKEAADFDLGRFRRFITAIGDPHKSFKSVHVAGTNGKGSTCQILASIYQQAGFRVGLYTSPHILKYTERFRIDGREIPETDLLVFFQDHQTMLKSFKLTYFEISTAVAFWWFERQQVEVAVIEAGLGGRLDATNIITPELSVITNVSIDHTEILGDDLESIAREKAGIIKQGVPVLIGNVPEATVKVFKQAAERAGSGLSEINSLKPRWRDGIYYLTPGESEIALETDLVTPVQAYNIAMAWRAVELLQESLPVTMEQKKRGIGRVRAIYPNLARFEQLLPGKMWYFDGAHNLEAVQALKKAISTIKPVDEAVLILALMRDKVRKPLMEEFSEFKKKFYHTIAADRAAKAAQIKEWLPDCEAVPGDFTARRQFFNKLDSELVIFAGSFYFYPTVREWLKQLP